MLYILPCTTRYVKDALHIYMGLHTEMAYHVMLKMDVLPKADYITLKQLVEKYNIPGKSSEAYSTLFSALIHLACEVSSMKEAHIEDGTAYVQRLIGEVMEHHT